MIDELHFGIIEHLGLSVGLKSLLYKYSKFKHLHEYDDLIIPKQFIGRTSSRSVESVPYTTLYGKCFPIWAIQYKNSIEVLSA